MLQFDNDSIGNAAPIGDWITAMRTIAVGSIGIKCLAPEDASAQGIIGFGIQGFHQALFLSEHSIFKQIQCRFSGSQ